MLRHTHPETTLTQPSPDVKKLGSVDAFRGLAILLVLVVHSSQFFTFSSQHLGGFLLQAARGVQLFYVLSAFSLIYGYYSRSEKGKFFVKDYFIRRLFRIAPLFWIVTAFYLFYRGLGPNFYAPNGIGWVEIVTTVFFINAWHPALICAIVPIGWSVAIEMMFYAFLPVVFKYVTSLRRALWWFTGSLVFAWTFGRMIMPLFKKIFPPSWQLIDYTFAWDLSLPAQLPVFLIGIVFYFVYRALKQTSDDHLRATVGKVFTLTAVIFLLTIIRTSVENKIVSEYVQYGLIWGLLLVGCLVSPSAIIDNKFTRFFGKISYSAYLWHIPVLEGFQKFAQANHYELPKNDGVYFILLPVFLIAISLAATISFYLIETPGIRLGEKLLTRLKERAA